MQNKAFTLVELLAVIVILAIILAIAIPGISGIISSSTESSFASDAKMLLKEVNYKLAQDDSFDVSTVNATNVNTLLGVSASNYQSIKITMLNGKPYIALQGQNKWSGLVAYGSHIKMSVSDSITYQTAVNQLGYNASKGVNTPMLATGMTPIKWNGTTWVNTSASDPNWYNYNTTNKIWANARTDDGSMWVWIPRYIYKITSNWHVNTTGTIDVQFSKGVDDNWNNSVIGNIDTGTTSNASNNKWTNHPGFDFGSTKLTGIWVAKFEPTAVEGIDNGYTADNTCPTASDNVTTKTIKILPNVMSWRCIQIGNAFTVSRGMETNSIYGWGTSGSGIDTHLMKNIEWGAIAYLSKSTYGQGANEIYINNNQNYITGCAGNTVSAAGYNGCQNTYESVGGVKASTTGNIYGIYDLSGGVWERVSANVDNANSSLNTYGSSIISADSKYRDIYTKGGIDDQTNNYPLTIDHKGDAVYETSNAGSGSNTSWFSDYSSIAYAGVPWFSRGGSWLYNSNAGVFVFNSGNGSPYSNSGFRPVLAVNTGL